MTIGFYIGAYDEDLDEIVWTDRHELIDLMTLKVTDGLGADVDSLSTDFLTTTDFIIGGEMLPLSGQICRLVINLKLFEGVIGAVQNVWSGGRLIHAGIGASSYIALLNPRLVVKQKMPATKAGLRLKEVLEEFGDTFKDDLSYIENGPDVMEQTYDYQSLASVIAGIASQTGYLWDVDYDRAVHFFVNLKNPAPISAIDVDTDLIIGDFTSSEDATAIANVIILKDFSSKSTNETESKFTADGQSSFFSLPMPPFDLESTHVYVKPEGEEEWVERDLLPDPLDGSDTSIQGSPGTAYLCVFNWGIRFPLSDLPGAGDQIKGNYHAEIPDRVAVVIDADSIAEFARREGSDGRHELVVSASDFRVTDDSPIEELGELILKRRAWPIQSGTFILRTINIGEWQPGQTFTIISAKRGIFDLKAWVVSGYSTKSPLRVWVTQIERSFEVHPDGVYEFDVVTFSNQPWEGGA
jgi:hypothetical protein